MGAASVSYGSNQKPTERGYLAESSSEILACLATPQGRGAVSTQRAPLTLGSAQSSSRQCTSATGTQSLKKQGTLARKRPCGLCSKDSGLALCNPKVPRFILELGAPATRNIYSEHEKLLFLRTHFRKRLLSSLGESLYLEVAQKLWVRPRGPGAVQSARRPRQGHRSCPR